MVAELEFRGHDPRPGCSRPRKSRLRRRRDPQLPASFRAGGGRPHYADLQRRLAELPPITVPAITLDGDADGVAPATDGSAQAARFADRRAHRVVPRAGHNLPQEAPEAFATAVMELIG